MVRYRRIRQELITILVVLAVSGCFDTTTKLTEGGSYSGSVRDGRYVQICRSGTGSGRLMADSAMGIAAKPLPDGRIGVEISGETVMMGEVLPLRPGFQLVGVKEEDRQPYENFLVVTAAGVTDAFATVVVPADVEQSIQQADLIGDAAAIRALLTTAIDARRYELKTAYVIADSLRLVPDGLMPLPPALEAVAQVTGQPLPRCEER